MHPRNKHIKNYDFDQLVSVHPELDQYLVRNISISIDFSDPKAVKELNKALLLSDYRIEYWNIPDGYLCPGVPGRADYIHYSSDLLASSNQGKIPKGKHIKLLDIGTGANFIYPLIAAAEYGWSSVGSEIDLLAVKSVKAIIAKNELLSNKAVVRTQENTEHILNGIFSEEEYFDLAICNPPFHESEKAAKAASQRKWRNLNSADASKSSILNFGGGKNELWCQGGELEFVSNYILESKNFPHNCFWYSSLISKESNLSKLRSLTIQSGSLDQRVISMSSGNKKSRILYWTFLNKKQRKIWVQSRWNRK